MAFDVADENCCTDAFVWQNKISFFSSAVPSTIKMHKYAGISVKDNQLSKFSSLEYCGSLITEEEYCDNEIRSGLAKAKFKERKKILAGKTSLNSMKY